MNLVYIYIHIYIYISMIIPPEPIFDVPKHFLDDQQIIENLCPEKKLKASTSIVQIRDSCTKCLSLPWQGQSSKFWLHIFAHCRVQSHSDACTNCVFRSQSGSYSH